MRIVIRWKIATGLVWCYRALFAAGCAALAFCAFTVIEADRYQSVNAPQFDRAASVPGPGENVVPPLLRSSAWKGAPISRLEIPRLGLSVLVAEGTSSHTLSLGAGHILGTAFPGETGNVGIAAHRDTFFRKLRGIHPGDTITLTTRESSWRYAVEWTRIVPPTDAGVLYSSRRPLLTLVTCYPFYYVGRAPQRFIVRARRLSNEVSRDENFVP